MGREEISNREWSIFTQQYPIGYKFSTEVLKVQPFGIFAEIKERPKDPYAALHRYWLQQCLPSIQWKKTAFRLHSMAQKRSRDKFVLLAITANERDSWVCAG